MIDRMASWQMESPGEPLALRYGPVPEPGPGEVVLEVKACGMCHTDVSFLYQGVRTNAPLPLTLGHEIVGTAIAGADEYLGRTYIVPSVMPCGDCDLCARGRGNICRHQKMPGNDFHGGFASHFLTPARFLCEVPEGTEDVEDLSVLADAVATAYQSVLRCDVKQNDMVVVVGAGGVGTFALQTAKARGAHTVAIDVDAERLERLAEYVDLPIDAGSTPTKEIRKAVAAYEKEHGLPGISRKVLGLRCDRVRQLGMSARALPRDAAPARRGKAEREAVRRAPPDELRQRPPARRAPRAPTRSDSRLRGLSR
jgi:6-hydroxycyclohex-1-ene-1-carbonyl-CoA dehydrogenase